MKYQKFYIENYRAIKEKLCVDLSPRIIPLVGVNECGKTTILQGIFCFDYYNDDENAGNHLINITNLYSTSPDGDCIISADIECTWNELVKCVSRAIQDIKESDKEVNSFAQSALATSAPSNVTSASTSEAEENIGIALLENFVNSGKNISSFGMTRNITRNKTYSCNLFNGLKENDMEIVCKRIIQSLPYVLYNDDFNDRPVSSISLTDDSKDGWYDIFVRVFRSANKDYDLKKITANDERKRKSILSDIEDFLSTTLTNAWKKFTPTKSKMAISISLEVNSEKNTLDVYIREQPKGKNSFFFKVTDRSKGFIWYYNFIMKIRFNPKQSVMPEETIFLLDEPGSYLHEALQAELCKKLKDISLKEGNVIYCTHSPKLLLPSIIPLNNVLIVEKQNGINVSVTPVSVYNNTKSKRKTAMQPIYEALQIPEYEMISTTEKIVCVEGIYDKYSIESFCELSSDIRVFASVSASAIRDNIQFFIAYQKQYIALWDNDTEGKREMGKAKKLFGEKEAEKFKLLPDVKQNGKARMEEMICSEDYKLLTTEQNLPDDATYETIVSSLYFLEKSKRNKLVNKLSDETRANFDALTKMINKGLQEV